MLSVSRIASTAETSVDEVPVPLKRSAGSAEVIAGGSGPVGGTVSVCPLRDPQPARSVAVKKQAVNEIIRRRINRSGIKRSRINRDVAAIGLRHKFTKSYSQEVALSGH
jgi:hypothetical protein